MTSLEKLVASMRLAALTGLYMGLIRTPADEAYIRRCTATHNFMGMGLIFTRDTGHHTSGWWKNPDYERCFHLSISFFDPATMRPAPFNREEARRMAKRFFGDNLKWVWVEPPYSELGRQRGVHHYRLFCDAGWNPIKPSGEVYSKENTPAGWKSFSEIHGDAAKQFEPPIGVA